MPTTTAFCFKLGKVHTFYTWLPADWDGTLAKRQPV
jgi:hypothetical protein